jgi:hypothetical protein
VPVHPSPPPPRQAARAGHWRTAPVTSHRAGEGRREPRAPGPPPVQSAKPLPPLPPFGGAPARPACRQRRPQRGQRQVPSSAPPALTPALRSSSRSSSAQHLAASASTSAAFFSSAAFLAFLASSQLSSVRSPSWRASPAWSTCLAARGRRQAGGCVGAHASGRRAARSSAARRSRPGCPALRLSQLLLLRQPAVHGAARLGQPLQLSVDVGRWARQEGALLPPRRSDTHRP